jgi:hypothetical protein
VPLAASRKTGPFFGPERRAQNGVFWPNNGPVPKRGLNGCAAGTHAAICIPIMHATRGGVRSSELLAALTIQPKLELDLILNRVARPVEFWDLGLKLSRFPHSSLMDCDSAPSDRRVELLRYAIVIGCD